MSQYNLLVDSKTGRPKWQVFYGDGQPTGEGWFRVSGPLPDGSKTTAKWYRSYVKARADKKASSGGAKKEEQPATEAPKKATSFWDKLGAVKSYISGKVATKSAPKPKRVKSQYKVGDRVQFVDGTTGYIQAILGDGDRYEVFNLSSGEGAEVAGADILAPMASDVSAKFAVGDAVVVGVGSAAGSPGRVVAVNDNGKVKVTTNKGDQWLDPSTIEHATTESDSTLNKLKKRLADYPGSRSERAVLGSLSRALNSNRSTTTLSELMDDLAITSDKYRRDDIKSALSKLNAIYPALAYNEKTESVDISAAKKGIETMAEKLGASVVSGPYGWSASPGNGVFSSPGMVFTLPAGTFVSVTNEAGGELKAEITHGIIVAHDSGAAVLEVTDSSGAAYKIKSSELSREDGKTFWEVVKDSEGKPIKPDPCDPSLFGDVVRDNFWLLRDREASRGTEPGDMVKTLPYAVADANGKFSDTQLSGRVLDRMEQTGLLRVQFEDGRVLDVSPRMVSLSRDIQSANDIHQLSLVRRSAVYGSTFSFASGAKISFGSPTAAEVSVREPVVGEEVEFMDGGRKVRGKVTDITRERGRVRFDVKVGNEIVTDLMAKHLTRIGKSGMPELQSTIRISFPSKEHFEKSYNDIFIKGGESGWLSRMFGGGTSQSDMFAGQEENPPYIPNQALMRTIMQLYPAADSISARAYNDPDTKELLIEIGPGKSVGRAFEMAEILPKVFNTPPIRDGAIRADDYERNNLRDERIDITSDGNSLYVRVGSKIDQNLEVLDALRPANAKTTKLYHAVTASKRRAFEALGKTDPELFHAISRFTYDPAGKRFVADISDYGEGGTILAGLKKLFGDVPVHESTDRTWWYKAGVGPVSKLADDRATVLKQIKGAKHNSELPPIKNFGHVDGFELFKVQKEVVNFITAPGQQAVLLANDQGTGKTPIITASIMKWAQDQNIKRALVVVPASITGNWREEIEAWTGKNPQFAKDNLVVLAGGDRTKDYQKILGKNPPLITLVSYDTLVRDYKELATVKWDAIALDEAQNIKNIGTKRERTIKKTFTETPYRIAATGTAIENSPEDMYSVMEFLQPDIFGSRDKFNNDFIEYDDVESTDSAGVKRTRTVAVGVKNLGLLRSKLLPVMVRVDKDKMLRAMTEEVGPKLKAELGVDVKLMGERIKRPWPTLQKRPDGKFEATFRPEDRELLIHRDDSTYPDYWQAHDAAVKYLVENTKSNPLTQLIYMQQVADDPALFAQHLSPDDPARKVFEKFDERNPDGTYRYKNPKRDRLLKEVKQHFADPKNGKIIVFSQSTSVLDKMQDWVYSDPEIRKHLGMSDKQFQDYLATRKLTTAPGILRYTGGMKSGMVKKDAADILKRIKAGEVSDVETEAAKKERAFVRHAFQNDPKTKILFASDAAQTGLTLTAANKVINYNLGWNPKAMDQRIDRAHRIDIKRAKELAGQGGARDVEAVNIIATGTADERKMPNLAWKDHMFDLIVSGQAGVDEDAIISAHNESNEEVMKRMYDEALYKKRAKECYGGCYYVGGGLRWL